MAFDQAAAETKLNALLTKAQAAQVNRGDGKAKFLQILDTDADWLAKANVSAAARAGISVSITEYEGSLGRGWEIVVTGAVAGGTWTRVKHFGPEVERERTWTLVGAPA